MGQSIIVSHNDGESVDATAGNYLEFALILSYTIQDELQGHLRSRGVLLEEQIAIVTNHQAEVRRKED